MGIGGGTIGYSLAKKGLSVLFIDKGSNYDSLESLKGNYSECFVDKTYDEKERLRLSGRAFDQILEKSEYKYPFIGSGTGGSSALYGMAMERFFPEDFNPREVTNNDVSLSNLPVDGWPFSYKDLAPYYTMAEKLYKVRGSNDFLKGNSKNGLLPPPPINDINKKLYDFLVLKNLNPYILPRASNFKEDCIECQGFLCPKNCKIDSFNACILPAIKNYKASIMTNSEVMNISLKGDSVKTITIKNNNKLINLKAEMFILAAGAIHTPYILLKSRNNSFPGGIANSSGQVGKNLMRHLIDLYIVKTDKKINPIGFMKEIAFNDLYNFENGRLGTVQSFGRPPDISILTDTVFNKISDYSLINKKYFKVFKPIVSELINKYFSKKVLFNSILEDLPYLENSINIDKNFKSPIINFNLFPYEKKLINNSRRVIKNIFKDIGVKVVKQAEDNKRLAHVCGTCRAGDNPKVSVLDSNCRSHDIKNLYITDASFFPTSGGTNPALTIAANALRVSDKII